MESRICTRCGGPIPAEKRKDAKYCSPKCKVVSSSSRARERPNYRDYQREYQPAWRKRPGVQGRLNEKKRRAHQKQIYGTELEDLTVKEARALRAASEARGFRSGLETKVAQQLRDAGVPVLFEVEKVTYTVPERPAKYTPDFKIMRRDGSHFYVETKGFFRPEDMKKHLHIKKCNPDVEIRFLFQSAKKSIRKGSPTTYSSWAEKHGFLWCQSRIPEDWLNE